MKTKFWSVCTIAVLALLGGVYFSTAQMSDAPLVLSDSQMEQLSGTGIRMDWDCVYADLCTSIPCDEDTLIETVAGDSTCTLCETEENNTCDSLGHYCVTCTVRQYINSCSGSYDFYREKVGECE